MSNQEVTYTEVRFPKSSSELENRVRLADTQITREADHQERSVPWHCIAVALGVLCALLLMAVVVVWVTQIQGKNKLQQSLKNISDSYDSMKKEKDLKEEMLKNKSREYEILKNLRDSNRCYGKNKITSHCLKSTGTPFVRNWFCCGPKCYYFLEYNKTWNECKQTCQDCRLSLLKIDDRDEQNFLQNFLHTHIDGNYYWIGLSYDDWERKWKWIDNGISNLNLTAMNLQYRAGSCAFFNSTKMKNKPCDRKLSCICEKTGLVLRLHG